MVALALLFGACSPRQLIVGSLADELAGQGQGSENDLELLRDAAPLHLKLSESILSRQPGHQALAESVAAGGVGFRYLIARKLGLYSGIDVARGPETTALYLQVGSAWR